MNPTVTSNHQHSLLQLGNHQTRDRKLASKILATLRCKPFFTLKPDRQPVDEVRRYKTAGADQASGEKDRDVDTVSTVSANRPAAGFNQQQQRGSRHGRLHPDEANA